MCYDKCLLGQPVYRSILRVTGAINIVLLCLLEVNDLGSNIQITDTYTKFIMQKLYAV